MEDQISSFKSSVECEVCSNTRVLNFFLCSELLRGFILFIYLFID